MSGHIDTLVATYGIGGGVIYACADCRASMVDEEGNRAEYDALLEDDDDTLVGQTCECCRRDLTPVDLEALCGYGRACDERSYGTPTCIHCGGELDDTDTDDVHDGCRNDPTITEG